MIKRETDETRPVRGVIGCLTAGFEMVTQNLHVVALPVVLDLFLWLGPRVSIRPLLQRFLALLTSQPPTDPEVAAQIDQAVRLLDQFGEQFNLLSIIGGVPFFQVPSLLARRAPEAGSPLGIPRIVSLSSALDIIPWWGALVLIGLVLGFLYLSEISRQVEEAQGPGLGVAGERDAAVRSTGHDSMPDAVWKLSRFLFFAFALMVVSSVILPLWVLTVALGASMAQPLGILLWVGGVGALSYMAIHLLFVIPGLLLGERGLLRAIGESVVLSHVSLSSVLGFVLLVVVIYEGLGYAWSLPRSDSWAMLIGIVGNAFVATGLTAAAFVFYRDRVTADSRSMTGRE